MKVKSIRCTRISHNRWEVEIRYMTGTRYRAEYMLESELAALLSRVGEEMQDG